MQGYLELKAWPDALAALNGLKASGLRMAFLSDFTAAMLDQAVKNSGLEGHSPRLNPDGTGPISFSVGQRRYFRSRASAG
jgi:2-haloacid dehalogenase